MCMADMFSRAGVEYAVAHCNFHLRGAESDADAEFVQEWAENHGVQFFREDFDTAAYAAEHGVSIEMAARDLRYAWFTRVAAEEGFDAVAVAHNANDNAETLILNLLRGTGLRGLRGMAADGLLPEGIRLLRPMLGMTREEIEVYAEEHRVEYRVDSTNADTGYKRNRIRNAVFPEFKEINPSFVRTLNADMERFTQVDDIAEDYFREAEGKILKDNEITLPELLALKHWKYVLFRILEPYGFHADTLGAVVKLLEDFQDGEAGTFSGKRFHSPTHVLETSAGAMTVRERPEAADVPEAVTVTGPGDYVVLGRTVHIEVLPREAVPSLKLPAGVLACDAATLPFPFLLRRWQPGDWMRPFGMGGCAKKLSDLFTDRKMSLSEKESAVVIVPSGETDGHVAAVAGVRMDEALRIAKGSETILRITLL